MVPADASFRYTRAVLRRRHDDNPRARAVIPRRACLRIGGSGWGCGKAEAAGRARKNVTHAQYIQLVLIAAAALACHSAAQAFTITFDDNQAGSVIYSYGQGVNTVLFHSFSVF